MGFQGIPQQGQGEGEGRGKRGWSTSQKKPAFRYQLSERAMLWCVEANCRPFASD